MLGFPENVALVAIPDIATSGDQITVRYLVAKTDVDRGAIELIIEGIGYGVGQITDISGLRVQPCNRMFSDFLRRPISHEIARGTLNSEWCFVDISISANEIDLKVLGFAGLLSLLAGDIFGRPYVREGLVLQDFNIPESAKAAFPGPRLGLKKILKECNASRTGLVLGLLLKPDMGMPTEYYADLAEAATQGGIDYIKEDELTLDSYICRRVSRVEAISKRLIACGRKPLYAANATSPSHKLLETSRQLVESGASALLINGLQVGLDAVAQIATANDTPVPIHIHRAGYDILTVGPKAISTSCLTKMFRLSGADIVHVGSPIGGIFAPDVVAENILSLTRPLFKVKRSLPVLSRSSIDTLDMMLRAPMTSGAMLLFDAFVYESPLGLERAIRRLKNRIESSSAPDPEIALEDPL